MGIARVSAQPTRSADHCTTDNRLVLAAEIRQDNGGVFPDASVIG